MDRELATKVSRKDGRKSYLAIAWELEVATIFFFLLAAAWVDPGRSALQSAEQWCKGRYGHIHQGKMSFCDKNMQKAGRNNTRKG